MSFPVAKMSQINYSGGIDFHELVQVDATFKQLLVDNHGRMDWQNPQHVMQLTKCLLRRDFGLTIDLPNDRLCPPVPGRYSYIKWLQSLVDTTSGNYMDVYDPERQVTGIDIGTGASAIYPLLGTASRSKWRFYATEIDEKSHSYAIRNVSSNGLEGRTRVLKVSPLEDILPLKRHKIGRADFTMCNPPFFASTSEMLATHDKAEPPSAVCTGAETEMITEGGDAAFVMQMVDESKDLGDRVQWYTSMLGKLSSVGIVVRKVKEIGCKNWAVGCLLTGGKTRRWVVAWSWIDLRPNIDVARCDIPHKDVLPFPTEYSVHTCQSQQELAHKVNELLASLDLQWHWRADLSAGIASTTGNVWSRAARRKKRQQAMLASSNVDGMDIDDQSYHAETSSEVQPDQAALVVRVNTHEEHVNLRWLKGSDSVLYESFCGMVKRELTK